jgi:hypothetical protein
MDYIAQEARTPKAEPDPWGERITAHRVEILAACERLAI